MRQLVISDEFKKGLYLGNIMQDIYVPERYSMRIVSHVVSNYMADNEYYKPPLYLAIQGKPGEGKTTQALAACVKKGFIVKYLSASELSGIHEGDSRDKIKEIYEQSLNLREQGFIICILLDDFHLGNSSISSKVGRTINSELLVSHMMNLVETYTSRVPIILTGNDYSGTYEALLRDGRADIFNWEPDFDEKTKIVTELFDPILTSGEIKKIEKFVKSYENQNIAFFVQLRNDLRRNCLEEALRKYQKIKANDLDKINDEVGQKIHRVDISSMRDLAEKRIKERKRGGLQ